MDYCFCADLASLYFSDGGGSSGDSIGRDGGSVDTKSGSNQLTEERLLVPCPGMSLELNLTYQSRRSKPDGLLGSGWNHSCEWSLDVQSDRALLHAGDGKTYAFMQEPGGGYLPSAYNHWTLNDEGLELVARRPGGIGYCFSTDGSLTKMEDAWGNQVGCSYGTNGCLEAATHSNGRQLVFSNVWNSAVSDWRIDSISVSNGPSLQFSYNNDGQFTQVVETVGLNSYTSTYQYADFFLTNRIDRAGHAYTYEYETGEDGLLNGKKTYGIVDDWYEQSIAYPSFQITDVTRTARGTNQIERYSRNDVNILAAIYGPAGTVEDLTSVGVSYSYADNKIDITEETRFDNNNGSTWSQWKLYDDAHNITNLSVGYNTTTPVHQMSVSYDPDWRLITSLTDADGYRTETVYTNGSPLVQKEFWSSTNSYDTYFAYTSNGLPCAVTNADESVTEFEYDEMGSQIAVVPEIGPSLTNTYNVLGYIESSEVLAENRASTGRIFQFETDPHGRITGIVFPDGLTNTYAYNALGLVTNEIDRAGRPTDYTYAPGEEERLTSVTQYLEQGGSNIPVRIAYDLDEQANVLRISEPRGRFVESYQLDIQDRLTAVTNIEGQVMSIDYSVEDFVTEITRFDGSRITNSYDSAGRKSSATYLTSADVPLSTNYYTYYADGMLKKISDGTGYVTNRYDGLNRLTYAKSITPSYQSTTYYDYDSFGNVTGSDLYVFYGSYWINVFSDYTYDEAGRLEEGNSTRYTYNPANGLTASTSNLISGIHCAYTYDIMDRIQSMTYRNASGDLIRSISYQYDALGMITNKTLTGVSSTNSTAYEYDTINRLVKESRTAGVSPALPASVTEYSYDLAGNRISKTVNSLHVSYSTICVGNRLDGWGVSASNGVEQLSWRIAGLSSEPVGTDLRWGHLWISNTLTQASSFPAISGNGFYTDQLGFEPGSQNIIAAIRDRAGNMGYVTNTVNCSLVTNALVAYNAAGCTTNIAYHGPAGYANALALGWNEQYQLTNVQRSTSNVLHSAISYSYDLLGRRASRTQDGISEYYVYDGDHVAFDLDASRRLKRFYAYGPGIDNVLFMQTYSSGGSLLATYYYIKDHQNTVLALADSSGNIVESYEYDAWGRVLAVKDTSGNELTSDLGLPISAIGNRYTFQGREIDWTTGLYHFRARWYNPICGRWLSKDPVGIGGGLNLYMFCGNNPINFIDAFGLYETTFPGGTFEDKYSGTRGFWNVGGSGIHGAGGSFSDGRGNLISAQDVYNKMKADGYKDGTPIKLYICQAGKSGGEAETLAMLAKAPVTANLGDVYLAQGFFGGIDEYPQDVWITIPNPNPNPNPSPGM